MLHERALAPHEGASLLRGGAPELSSPVALPASFDTDLHEPLLCMEFEVIHPSSSSPSSVVHTPHTDLMDRARRAAEDSTTATATVARDDIFLTQPPPHASALRLGMHPEDQAQTVGCAHPLSPQATHHDQLGTTDPMATALSSFFEEFAPIEHLAENDPLLHSPRSSEDQEQTPTQLDHDGSGSSSEAWGVATMGSATAAATTNAGSYQPPPTTTSFSVFRRRSSATCSTSSVAHATGPSSLATTMV